MIDYQYFPNMDDPVAKLRLAMDNMDGMYFLHAGFISFCIIKAMSLYQCKPSPRTQSQRKTTATNHFMQRFQTIPRM